MYIYAPCLLKIMNTDNMRQLYVRRNSDGAHHICAEFVGDGYVYYLAEYKSEVEAAVWLNQIFKALDEGQRTFDMTAKRKEMEDGQSESS